MKKIIITLSILSTAIILAACTATANLAILDTKTDTPIPKATMTTKYDENLANRTKNLQLATKAINSITIPPGQTFSFNRTLGETTAKKGYKPAKIFVNGKETIGIGGGICQVSSTLYNAADYAGLKIIERHPHSKAVDYVPKGRDAATSYGGVDLKFKNTLDKTIKINATAEKGELEISLSTLT